MTLGPPGRRKEPLNVFGMALALAAAAILGAALGLAWHWANPPDAEQAPAEEG